MAIALERDPFMRMVGALRHWMLCVACAATLASCGGGQREAAAPPASPGEATGTDATIAGSNICDPITLAPPRAVSDTHRIALTWQGPAFKTVTVWVQAAAGKTFERIDALVIGHTAEFSRGPTHRLDFPTARVRVRGCTEADGCIDSNEQPLLDALLDTTVHLPSPKPGGTDGFGSAVAMSADGNTLAVAGSAMGDTVGHVSHLHLFQRDPQGRWQKTQVLEPPACMRFVVGSATLDATGDTLAASSEPLTTECLPHAGTIEVFTRSGTRWEHAAHIADDPERVVHRFGRLSLAGDGRTLAASAFDTEFTWLTSRARVYVRDDGGHWLLATTLEADASGAVWASFGTPRLSGNGRVLAVQGHREVIDQRYDVQQPDPFVALFTREGPTSWTARTMVRSTKPSDCCAIAEDNDWFGTSLALDHEGNTLAVGAPGDNSGPGDAVGDPDDRGAGNSGAVWIYTRTSEVTWTWQAFVKAPGAAVNNTAFPKGSYFLGASVALDHTGRVLAATAMGLSQPAGVNRNHEADRDQRLGPVDIYWRSSDGPAYGGAAYVFAVDDAGRWMQRAAVMPPLEPRSRRPLFDSFAMALSADASTLVLGVTEIEGEDAPVASGVFVY